MVSENINFVMILDPQPPPETAEVISGEDGFVYAMPADPDGLALEWWETSLIPYQDNGVWCLGEVQS